MERNRRWGLLALVTVGLVVVALISLSSSAWATPALEHARQQSIPPFKTADESTVVAGEELVFKITFTAGPGTWHNVVVTDNVDPHLRIDSVWTSQGSASWAGQLVTVDVGDVPAGTKVTIRIRCTVLDTIAEVDEIENCALVVIEDPTLDFWVCTTIDVELVFVPEGGSLLLLGTGLAGLAGYAGMRRRARVR